MFGLLAVSRALGDFELKKIPDVVLAEPGSTDVMLGTETLLHAIHGLQYRGVRLRFERVRSSKAKHSIVLDWLRF